MTIKEKDDLAETAYPSEIEEEGIEEEKKRFSFLSFKLPKWALGLLMTIPALILIGIILLVNYYVGFPSTINPIAIIAITGLVLVGFVVLSDMAYRNYFSYRMIRRESAKSKIYKEIIKEKQAAKATKNKFEKTEDEYKYDDESEGYDEEEEEEIGEETEEEVIEEEESIIEEDEEYTYEIEEDDSKYYRLKSLIFRGGIFSILIVNGLILLAAAFILQLTIGGGFVVPTE